MYHKQLIGLLIKDWVKYIYNKKKPISLRKGIGFCQQSERKTLIVFLRYNGFQFHQNEHAL